MKKVLLNAILFTTAISLTVLSSCRFGCVKGSGHQVTQSNRVSNFTRIDISGGFKVNLKQDSSLGISITADDNLMKYIRTSVDGNRLHIYTKRSLCGSGEMVINIGVKSLESIKSSGAIDLNSDGKLVTKDLYLGLNGASKVNMDLDAANVTTEGSGSAEINLKGEASSHKVSLSGSGKIYALDFVVGSYDIETTGASHCEINVLHDLNVNTTGASEIQYRGNPTNVNNHKTGASSLTKIN
ncbi:head GIN domain-containing protein [Mucilaginibacter sp. McL0603]|uniref:head GIN domain-containing protein n=1 Tax=Mucilaginibacter sp. McL0603 TaxID=3415670 RepID=UPI003CF5B813